MSAAFRSGNVRTAGDLCGIFFMLTFFAGALCGFFLANGSTPVLTWASDPASLSGAGSAARMLFPAAVLCLLPPAATCASWCRVLGSDVRCVLLRRLLAGVGHIRAVVLLLAAFAAYASFRGSGRLAIFRACSFFSLRVQKCGNASAVSGTVSPVSLFYCAVNSNDEMRR